MIHVWYGEPSGVLCMSLCACMRKTEALYLTPAEHSLSKSLNKLEYEATTHSARFLPLP